LIESDWTHALAACARAIPSAPSEKFFRPAPFEENQSSPNQISFESTFSELSRVNDSLIQKIIVHRESGHQKERKKPVEIESETGTSIAARIRHAFGGSA
jgi:hypothetical protein